MTKYVGLSLSFCIKDICEGRVPLKDVEKIIAGTCAMSEHEWELLLNQYSEVYWRECKECALQAVEYLRSRHLIDQPRMRGEAAHNIAAGHWIAITRSSTDE